MKRFASIVALALAALAGCGRSPPALPRAALPAVSVRTVAVERTTLRRTQPVAGTIRPAERAVVAAKIAGAVADANFAVGQAVAPGEVLVTLSAAEMTARVEQARAALDQAKRDVVRENTLFSTGASSAEAVRSAEDRLRIAQGAFNEAETMMGYTRVAAPFAGVVARRLVNTGDFASPGTALFEIEGTDRLRAEVQVPEMLVRLAPGAEVRVEVDDRSVNGRVAEASPSADAATRTRLAKVDLPPATAVRSGQFVRVLWPAGDSPVLLVPAEAVTLFGQIERAFAVVEGRAQLRLVKTGAREGQRVQIVAGLDAGETVILSPPAALRDGQPVQVQP